MAADKRPRPELVAVAEVLPTDAGAQAEPPPLGAEQLRTALARANAQHAKLTEELRILKAGWAKRNIQARQCREPIPVAEIKHVETRRRELHLALEQTQSEVRSSQQAIREHKADRQAFKPGKSDPVQQRMPESDHPVLNTGG